jgi:probable rRNA maturation factor
VRRREKGPVLPVRVVNRQRLVPVPKSALESVLAHILAEEGVPESLAVEVTLVRDRDIQPVNRDHLGRDRPTDVLAFPYLKPAEWRKRAIAAPRGGRALLGEVLVSADQAAEMARERRVDAVQAVAHLAVHGVLHLMGYDHKREAEAREMRRIERRYIRHWRRVAGRAAGSGNLR